MAAPVFGSIGPKDPQIYQSCHRQFTRHLPGSDDPLLRQVRTGKISAVDACLKLLSEFHLSPEGNLLPTNSGRAVEVLNTFHDLHVSWFKQNDFVYYSNDCQLDSMRELQDLTAPALYYDFSLFDEQNKNLEYVVSSRDGLFPLRSQTENQNSYFASHQELLSFGKGTEVFGRKFFGFRGRLVGIAKEGPDVRIKKVLPLEKGSAPAKDIPLYRSLGPGFTGHPSYILKAGLRAPGRYATNLSPAFVMARQLMHDLLCIDVPQLEEEDVSGMVDTRSPLSFKHDTRCIACHATLYPMATIFRNFGIVGTGTRCLEGRDQNVFGVIRFPTTEAVGDREVPFHRTQAEGKLFYRDFQGELVAIPIGSPEELAAQLKESPQFYYCSASRYFEFLTGIDPRAQTPRNAEVPGFLRGITSEYLKHRKPKRLIESILKSEFYLR